MVQLLNFLRESTNCEENIEATLVSIIMNNGVIAQYCRKTSGQESLFCMKSGSWMSLDFPVVYINSA